MRRIITIIGDGEDDYAVVWQADHNR